MIYAKIYSWIYSKVMKNICGVTTEGGMFFFPCDTRIEIHRTARIFLSGHFRLNGNTGMPNGRTTLMRMQKESTLIVKKDFSFFYGADIQLFEGGELILGNSFINSNCKIRCFKSITIGDRCAISHEVTIIDADGHEIDGRRDAQPIIIEDDVWIGTRATILKGGTYL